MGAYLQKPLCTYQAPNLSGNRDVVKQLQEVLQDALKGATFQAIVERMRQVSQVEIAADNLGELLKTLGTAYGIREAEQEGVLLHLQESQDMTQYGVANAVTRYAQDVDSYDRATQLEAVGYDLMSMTRRRWDHFNEFAVLSEAA